ncbi:hypothetical protein KAR91_26415 [Candidatus Pacearchaeota archaeon]|nr:hypothetical protein [Candidatus Pacearchaeota archaeon]
MNYNDIPKITKESVISSINKSFSDGVSIKINKNVVGTIKSITTRTLKEMSDAGVIKSSEVLDVKTVHQRKSLLGKIGDFICWRTPYHRVYYKPFYVQIFLSDHLEHLFEYTGLFDGVDQEVKNEILEMCGNSEIWEERYPDNPYTIIVSDINFRPNFPIKLVNLKVDLEKLEELTNVPAETHEK